MQQHPEIDLPHTKTATLIRTVKWSLADLQEFWSFLEIPPFISEMHPSGWMRSLKHTSDRMIFSRWKPQGFFWDHACADVALQTQLEISSPCKQVTWWMKCFVRCCKRPPPNISTNSSRRFKRKYERTQEVGACNVGQAHSFFCGTKSCLPTMPDEFHHTTDQNYEHAFVQPSKGFTHVVCFFLLLLLPGILLLRLSEHRLDPLKHRHFQTIRSSFRRQSKLYLHVSSYFPDNFCQDFLQHAFYTGCTHSQ